MSTTTSVPIERWGKDHWSTLGYLECRVVDHRGYLDVERMRCHPRTHHRLAHEGSAISFMAHGKFPSTTLADGTELDGHDDWSCVEDMIDAGLVTMTEEDRAYVGRSPRFALTAPGTKLAAALRAHKSQGGSFKTFVPAPELLPRDSAS